MITSFDKFWVLIVIYIYLYKQTIKTVSFLSYRMQT